MSALEDLIRTIERAKIEPKIKADVDAFILTQGNNIGDDEAVKHTAKQLIAALVNFKLERRIAKRIEEVQAFLESTEDNLP